MCLGTAPSKRVFCPWEEERREGGVCGDYVYNVAGGLFQLD